MDQDIASRKRRLLFRATHRGVKEADLMIGGFVQSRLDTFSPDDMDWLERLMEETDADIMAWIIGAQSCPALFDGPLMDALRRLDYMQIPR